MCSSINDRGRRRRIAPLGQSSRQASQCQHSSGNTTRGTRSAARSKRNICELQIAAQVPQPVHLEASITGGMRTPYVENRQYSWLRQHYSLPKQLYCSIYVKPFYKIYYFDRLEYPWYEDICRSISYLQRLCLRRDACSAVPTCRPRYRYDLAGARQGSSTGDAAKSCFAQVLEQIQNEHAPEFFSERLTPCIPFSLPNSSEHILPGRE